MIFQKYGSYSSKLNTKLHLQVCFCISFYQIVTRTDSFTVPVSGLPELNEKHKSFVQYTVSPLPLLLQICNQ